jgi:hypothetical protein
MRFLLTSAGIKNTSIHNALVDLLGKPIAESSALCIPTAAYNRRWAFSDARPSVGPATPTSAAALRRSAGPAFGNVTRRSHDIRRSG